MLPDFIIRPGLTLVCIFGVYLFFPKLINVQIIIALSIVVAIIALLISVRWLRFFLPEGFGATQPQYQINEWIKSAPADVCDWRYADSYCSIADHHAWHA